MADPVTPVGASSSNPNRAMSPAESEVTTNRSAAMPSGTGAAPTTNPSSGPASVSDIIAAYVAATTSLVSQLKASLPRIDAATAKHHSTVGPKQLQVVPMVVAMLRAYPKLSGSTADEIDAVSNDVDACNGLSASLKDLLATVDDTGRLRLEYNWQVVSAAIGAARKQAPRIKALATAVAAIDAVLAKGPRAEQAAHAVVKAQAKVTKADARAATARAKLAAKTAAASALQHGTGGAVVTQPAPTAPSAPASGATPGTPGSTTIR